MFCPNCGNNIPDNSAFCGYCGTSFAAQAAPAYAPAAPDTAYAQPYGYAQPGTSAKMRGVSKKQFLATEAGPEAQKAGKMAMTMFAVILALILLATITVNTISVVNLPIIKMAVDEREREELVDSMEQASELLEDAEDMLDDIKDEFGGKAYRQTKKVINKWEKLSRKISLAHLIAVVDATHDLADGVSDKLGMDGEVEELEDIAKILKTVRTITYIFGVVIVLLALWAATKKLTGVCVLGILLSVPVYCLLASVLLGILILVAFIVLAVFTAKVNKAWKAIAY